MKWEKILHKWKKIKEYLFSCDVDNFLLLFRSIVVNANTRWLVRFSSLVFLSPFLVPQKRKTTLFPIVSPTPSSCVFRFSCGPFRNLRHHEIYDRLRSSVTTGTSLVRVGVRCCERRCGRGNNLFEFYQFRLHQSIHKIHSCIVRMNMTDFKSE